MPQIIDLQHFLSALVPRAGVEPARVAPLVFETSASTDSAIWASKSGTKVRISEDKTKKYSKFFVVLVLEPGDFNLKGSGIKAT